MSDMRVGGAGAPRGEFGQPAAGGGGVARGNPRLAHFEGMGIEALAAMLMSESARNNGELMRGLQRDAKESQANALAQQADALHEKASDMASEALVAGSITAAGGALTVASVAAMPTPNDAGKAAQTDAVLAKQWTAKIATQEATSKAIAGGGQAVTGMAAPVAKGTYGAQQTIDDAEATRHAAAAKFAEAAKDEYASLAREFDAGAQKALQILQAMVVERHAVRRGLLQR